MIITYPIIPKGRRRLVDLGQCSEIFDWFICAQKCEDGSAVHISKYAWFYGGGLTYSIVDDARLLLIVDDEIDLDQVFESAIEDGYDGIAFSSDVCKITKYDDPMIMDLPCFPVSMRAVCVFKDDKIKPIPEWPIADFMIRHASLMKCRFGFPDYDALVQKDPSQLTEEMMGLIGLKRIEFMV